MQLQTSAASVRLLSVGLIVAQCVIPLPLVYTIIWLERTKHYNLNTTRRAVILVSSGVIGPALAVISLLAGLDNGDRNYPLLAIGAVLVFAPFLYSLIKPMQALSNTP